MRSSLITAIRYTIITTVLLGIVYPLIVTGIAQVTMRDKANGQLITRNGVVIGSAIIGQNFTSANYFHGRPSAAGNGYDAANSGGSNLAQSNSALVDRINSAVAAYQKQNPGKPVPIDHRETAEYAGRHSALRDFDGHHPLPHPHRVRPRLAYHAPRAARRHRCHAAVRRQ